MNTERIRNVAVVIAGIDEEYQSSIISGINAYAKEHNINISYFAAFGGMLGSRRFDIGEYSIYNLIDFCKFDGAILMTNTISDPTVKEHIISSVKESEIPTVVIDCYDYPDFHSISVDNSTAMTELIRHVIVEHNAKVINYVSGPQSNPEARSRYRAFLTVMAENDLEVEDARIYFGEFRSNDGKLAVEDFAAKGLSLPDAFICANDAMALTVVSSLEKLGYKVPDDVIVTGFDYTYNARNASPSLTSVKRPLFEEGYKACNFLLDILKGKIPDKNARLASVPVFSESCGCKAESPDDFKHYKKNSQKKIENTNRNISLLNRLTAGLADTENAEDNFKVLESFIEELGCERFSLCLLEDWQDNFNYVSNHEEPSYADYMTAPLIWDKGTRKSVDCFPSSDMFPEPVTTGGNINYFLPLHFGDRCLGYYIITNGDFPTESLLCHTLTMNISNSIENIRKLFHLNKAMDELNRLYVIDPLCNIYNRNGFVKIADDMFKDSVSKKQPVMLTFIDMDGLKFINDNYGHNEGDFAIQRLSGVIQDCCGNNSICARLGGDEFVLFTTGVTKNEDEMLARKFSKKIDNMNALIKKPYTLSASLGSVITDASDGSTLYSVIKQADEKMYEIKKMKKNSRANADK